MDRKKVYEDTVNSLFDQYNKIRSSGIDTGMSGNKAEKHFLKWLNEWMPKKIESKSGAIISVDDGPTNQMDCVLFDSYDNPSFEINEDDGNIFPIEGVVGAIELNVGENTSYQKIIKDCEKLTRMLRMCDKKIIGQPKLTSIVKFGGDINSVENLKNNLYHFMTHEGKPLSLICVEDINGSLEEAAKRIMEHNKSVGIRYSIDGLFVLKQGFALHKDTRETGWVIHRQAGTKFCTSLTEPKIVLLRLQSITLSYLQLMGKISSAGFDRYFYELGLVEQEMSSSITVSDSDYISQEDPGTVSVM